MDYFGLSLEDGVGSGVGCKSGFFSVVSSVLALSVVISVDAGGVKWSARPFVKIPPEGLTAPTPYLSVLGSCLLSYPKPSLLATLDSSPIEPSLMRYLASTYSPHGVGVPGRIELLLTNQNYW